MATTSFVHKLLQNDKIQGNEVIPNHRVMYKDYCDVIFYKRPNEQTYLKLSCHSLSVWRKR